MITVLPQMALSTVPPMGITITEETAMGPIVRSMAPSYPVVPAPQLLTGKIVPLPLMLTPNRSTSPAPPPINSGSAEGSQPSAGVWGVRLSSLLSQACKEYYFLRNAIEKKEKCSHETGTSHWYNYASYSCKHWLALNRLTA